MIVDKPWGKVATYALNQPSSVRVITVEPGQETSVHYHRMRDEIWVVLDPGLTIEIGNRVVEAQPGEEFVIPAEETHRIRCTRHQARADPRDRLRLHDRGRHAAPRGRVRALARAGLVTTRSPSSTPVGPVPYTSRPKCTHVCSPCTGRARCFVHR